MSGAGSQLPESILYSKVNTNNHIKNCPAMINLVWESVGIDAHRVGRQA